MSFVDNHVCRCEKCGEFPKRSDADWDARTADPASWPETIAMDGVPVSRSAAAAKAGENGWVLEYASAVMKAGEGLKLHLCQNCHEEACMSVLFGNVEIVGSRVLSG